MGVSSIQEVCAVLSLYNEDIELHELFVEAALGENGIGQHYKIVVPTEWVFWLEDFEDFAKDHAEFADLAALVDNRPGHPESLSLASSSRPRMKIPCPRLGRFRFLL